MTNNTSFTVNYRTGTDTVNSYSSTDFGAFLMSGGILNLISAFTTNGAYTQTSGTLTASSFSTSSTFSLSGGNLNVGSFTQTGSGALSLTGGTLNDTGTLTTSSVFAINGGTLQNATIANSALLSFSASTSNALDNVTLAGSNGLTVNGTTAGSTGIATISDAFSFTSGAVFNLGTTNGNGYLLFNSTSGNLNPVFNNATVNLGGSSLTGYLGFGNGFSNTGQTLTLGSGLTVQGKGTIGNTGEFTATGANFVNNGTISANTANSALSVNGAINGTITNNGIMQADASNATLSINGNASFTNNGTVQASNGGIVALAGKTTTLGNLFVTTGGIVELSGGTITGTITAASQSALSFTASSSNLLDNVTLSGPNGLSVNGVTTGGTAVVHIADSFSFTSGAVFNIGTTTGTGELIFDSTSGNASPTFDNATVNVGSSGSSGELGFGTGYVSGDTLTLGSGLTVQGKGTIGEFAFNPLGVVLINNGTVSANIASGGLFVDSASNGGITNNGTMQANANNAILTINPSFLFSNSGIVQAASNGKVTINGNAFTNTGIVQVNSGSTLALDSTASTQTGGTTVVNGAMTISNSNSNFYNLQGGALYGTGTINGNINNTGAVFGAGTPGASPTTGTLTETGNYTQSGTGVFSAAIGGTAPGSQFDFFTVSGSAVLGGYLDISLINGFVPTVGQSFLIISDSSQTGTFTNAPGNMIMDDSGRYLFQVVYGSNYVRLNGAGEMPEPDAGTLMLLTLVPGAVTLMVRRRRGDKATHPS